MPSEKYQRHHTFRKRPNYSQILTYVVVLGTALSFYLCVLKLLNSEVQKQVFISIFSILLGLMSFCAICTGQVDPTDNLTIAYLSNKENFNQYLQKHEPTIQAIDIKQCPFCRSKSKSTNQHCCECQRCIQQRDHHCKYLNICIGKKNYKVFYMTVCLTLAYFTMYLISLAYATHQIDNNEEYNKKSAQFIVAWIAGCGVMIAWLLIFALFCFHSYLIYANVTTIEFLKETKKNNEIARQKKASEEKQMQQKKRKQQQQEERQMQKQMQRQSQQPQYLVTPQKKSISPIIFNEPEAQDSNTIIIYQPQHEQTSIKIKVQVQQTQLVEIRSNHQGEQINQNEMSINQRNVQQQRITQDDHISENALENNFSTKFSKRQQLRNISSKILSSRAFRYVIDAPKQNQNESSNSQMSHAKTKIEVSKASGIVIKVQSQRFLDSGKINVETNKEIHSKRIKTENYLQCNNENQSSKQRNLLYQFTTQKERNKAILSSLHSTTSAEVSDISKY